MNVDFLLGKNGREWVWVMGEHKNDKSIDEMIELEIQESALKETEREIRGDQVRYRKISNDILSPCNGKHKIDKSIEEIIKLEIQESFFKEARHDIKKIKHEIKKIS